MALLRSKLSVWFLEAAVVDCIDIFRLVFTDRRIGLGLDCVDNWVGCFVEWFSAFVKIPIGDFYCGCPVSVLHLVVNCASDFIRQFSEDHLLHDIIDCQ